MNLVHVRLRLPDGFTRVEALQQLFLRYATAGDGVEHISVHPGDGPELTMGFWISGAPVLRSEQIAYTVALRALVAEPDLGLARVTSYSSALVPPAYDEKVRTPPSPGRYMRWTDEEGGEG